MTVIQAMKRIAKGLSGILPPSPKTEIDGKITDLPSKNIVDLIELRERQAKLLKNKSFILKLSDKGAKIQAFHDKLVHTITAKQEEEQTCRLLENLTLSKESVQNIEWESKGPTKADVLLDSDDDSEPEDVLHILSQSTSQEKKVKVLKEEKPLITHEDLINIGEVPYVKHLVDKTENNIKSTHISHFKPFKTTKSDVHNPQKEILRKKHKYWEITAATPPPIVHGPARILNLEESLQLEIEYNVHIKEVEAQHAAERLLSRSEIKMAQLPKDTSTFGKHREGNTDDSNDSDVEGSDKEVHDEEPERGGVIFTVMK